MELKKVDPNEVTVSEFNERQVGESDPEFVENVKKMGLVQPPIVRSLDGDSADARMGARYGAVIGGRRVGAAQEAGLDEIPVVVMDEWDDGEALAASITENIDAFRNDVDPEDRARALGRLKRLNEWSNSDLADEIGVARTTLQKWLEPLEWETDSFEAEVEGNEMTGSGQLLTKEVDEKPSLDTMQQVRWMAGDEKEKVLETVQQEDLSEIDVREARERVDRGDAETPMEAVKQVAQEKKERQEAKTNGSVTVHTRTTFTGDYAEGIDAAAKDRGASKDQVVRTAVVTWLEGEGYL